MSLEFLAWSPPSWIGSASATLACAFILWVGKRIGDKLAADKAEAKTSTEEGRAKILGKIEEVRVLAEETNGTVREHTIQIAVLEDRQESTSEARRSISEAARVAAQEIREAAGLARDTIARDARDAGP